MLFPTYTVDNFFDDPYKVVKFASGLDYKKDPEGIWPGKRTKSIFHIDKDFFQFATTKIMRLIYPDTYNQLFWVASLFFQLVDYGEDVKEGWIHKDTTTQLSSVIYLSQHKGCGTSIYKPKFFHRSIDVEANKIRTDYFLNNKKFDKKFYNALQKNNSRFEKSLQIDSCFNRLVLYDGHQWHSADGFFDKAVSGGRLTLVSFIHQIYRRDTEQVKFPVPEMKRTIG